jgi:hypothetical protein
VPSGGGLVQVDERHGAAGQHAIVTLNAIPASGYRFEHWSGAASGTSSSVGVTIDSEKSIVAHFSPVMVSLSTDVFPSGGGTVSPFGGEYLLGTHVTLTAAPSDGYAFVGWRTDTASWDQPTITIAMDSDMLLSAIFANKDSRPDDSDSIRATQKVLFVDDFSSATGDWETLSTFYGAAYYDSGRLCIDTRNFDEKYYTSADLSDSRVVACGLLDQVFTDYAIQVQVSLLEGTRYEWCGVKVHGREASLDRYFAISASGTSAVFRSGFYDWLASMQSNSSPHIQEGLKTSNVLRIECVGPEMRMFVNEHLVQTIVEPSLIRGDSRKVSLFVYAGARERTSSTSAFDDFTIYDLTA